MAEQVRKKIGPDYRKIYTDLLKKKFPHRQHEFAGYLDKEEFSAVEIIELNRKLFGETDKETGKFNQRHRSYSRSDIFKILDYQKKYRLNNTQLANHFKLSRNTVAKWKKMFLN